MDDGIGCFFITVIVVALLGLAVATRMLGDKSGNKECKAFFGSEYVYVYGDRSPDLCVSKIDGTIKYYSLIGK